jgi:hypothetical protein
MSIRIEELDEINEKVYEEFLKKFSKTMLYHSLRYRFFLREILDHSVARYLLAYENEELVAVLPAFVIKGCYGAVVNSLPFFGSNGSIIAKENCSEQVFKVLLKHFELMCIEEKAITSTIITNPLEGNKQIFNDYKPDAFDERIGQLTELPELEPYENLEERLMSLFHVKTRNLVRKGKKSGFDVFHDGSDETFKTLHELHERNMRSIGGIAKTFSVFQGIRNNFEYDKDYRIYVAMKDGKFAAGLLVFFCNKTAEYFIPVIHQDYRSMQPLSYLIFIAMKDAIKKGCNWWNWGGTWLTQNGVYHFKSRWGTKDYKYKYLVKVYSDITELKQRNIKDYLDNYPYCYVLPFDLLKGD